MTDWRGSPPHIDLLAVFVRPRDVSQVLNWQYLPDSIKESPTDAVTRFINEGLLVDCDLHDVIDRSFQVSDLKKFAKEEGLQTTGTKSALIERLVASARVRMEQLTERITVLKCSLIAKEFVEEFARKKKQALHTAKQRCFQLLLQENARTAYETFLRWQQEYVTPDFEARSYDIKEISFVLSGQPNVLRGIAPSDLANLRAATCMSILWRPEAGENWLSEDFKCPANGTKAGISYLRRNADLRQQKEEIATYTTKAKIIFDEYDIDSCELCRGLNGTVLALEEIPELPLENCTSRTGCKCRVEGVSERVSGEHPLSLNYEIRVIERDEDVLSKLNLLKKMRDSGLITEQEYEDKKSQILSAL
jgi:hypothetical protein